MAKRNGGIIGPSNVPAGPLGAAKGVWRLRDAFNYIKAGLWPVVLGYQIPNSLRFNRGSSDQLTRTLASTGDQQKSTWSCWIKKCDFTNEQIFFGYSTAEFAIYTNADSFRISNSDAVIFLYSTALQRDPSAWYHFVVAIDTTQATASNRIRMYVNGTELTSFTNTGYPTQNTNLKMNVSGKTMVIGSDGTSALNGYMSEHYWIDGQQLTPSSFGQTDSTTGIWTPIAYTGTYGTNGFYQKYANSAALGTDSSGNGNNFTVNNLTSVDQSTDTPTNNFATVNILTCNDTGTLTAADGNLTITGGNDMGATVNISKGKWYWESKRSNTGTVAHWGIGFTQSWDSSTQIVSGNGSGYFFRNDFSGGLSVSNSGSNGFTNISTSSTGSSVANGDIIGVALDLDSATKSVTFYQNGSQVAAGTFSYDGTTTFCTPLIRNNSGAQSQWNFGSPPYAANSYTDANGFGNFSYAVPSGYYSLCSKNLALYG